MKNKTKFMSIILILSLIIVCFSGCKNIKKVTDEGEDYSKYTSKSFQTLEYFGTTSIMVLSDDFKNIEKLEKAQKIWTDIKAKLKEIDNAISVSKSDSDVSKFNLLEPGKTLEISGITYDLLMRAKAMFDLTEGAYNPAVGMLVDLWGFAPRFMENNYQKTQAYDRQNPQTELPQDIYIQAFKKLCNFEDIKLEQNEKGYFVTKPNNFVEVDGVVYTMKLDLGGIGKGYAVDIVNKILKSNGYNFGYLSIGTSSIAVNKAIVPYKKTDNKYAWEVDIVHPRETTKYNGKYLILPLSDTCLSTSGDYEHSYKIAGRNYCHIIDSKTGYPIDNEMQSASVVCESASDADALTTALCVMNKEKAMDFVAKKLTNCKVGIVASGAFYTNMSPKEYKLTADIKLAK